jgi:hypothetical protein
MQCIMNVVCKNFTCDLQITTGLESVCELNLNDFTVNSSLEYISLGI